MRAYSCEVYHTSTRRKPRRLIPFVPRSLFGLLLRRIHTSQDLRVPVPHDRGVPVPGECLRSLIIGAFLHVAGGQLDLVVLSPLVLLGFGWHGRYQWPREFVGPVLMLRQDLEGGDR